MEHLEQELLKMGAIYQNKVAINPNFYAKIAEKIHRKQIKMNNLRIYALIVSIALMLCGILLSKVTQFHQLGTYFAFYVYLFYGFALMVFIIGLMLNAQKFLLRVLGHHLLKKINSHACFFTEKEDSHFVHPKAVF